VCGIPLNSSGKPPADSGRTLALSTGSESGAMELITFLILLAATVTVGLAGARGVLYLIFRFLMRGTAAPLAVRSALPPNVAR